MEAVPRNGLWFAMADRIVIARSEATRQSAVKNVGRNGALACPAILFAGSITPPDEKWTVFGGVRNPSKRTQGQAEADSALRTSWLTQASTLRTGVMMLGANRAVLAPAAMC